MELSAILFIINRWAHILSVVILIGGTVFARVVLLPAIESALAPEQRKALRDRISARWKMIVHASIAVLLITGGVNVMNAVQDQVKPMPYHAILTVKLLAAFTIFFIVSALCGSSSGFAKMRQNGRKWLGIQIGLAAFVILLSGVLKVLHTTAG